MSDVSIRAGLIFTKGTFRFSTQPTSFTDSVTTAFGPTPGAITATTAGVNVDLSALTTPGYVRLSSQEPTGGNFVSWGLFVAAAFEELGELGPGEFAVFKFTRTFLASGNDLRFVADTASVPVLIEAFEK